MVRMHNMKTDKDVYVYGFVDHDGQTFAVCYPNDLLNEGLFGVTVEFECKATDLYPVD